MITLPYLSINISGYLMNLDIPKVMGILNVTPDSFYKDSASTSGEKLRERADKMIGEGAEIIDVGGCSTRPGYEAPDVEEEIRRVMLGCSVVREVSPSIALSVDTFRSEVMKAVADKYSVNIINDISGGEDPELWRFAAERKLAYVLTHNAEIDENKDATAELITWLSKKANELHRLGVNDVIIDPGFGFGKTISQNFSIFEEIDEIKKMGLPVLVGISRKSMLYKTLGITPEESLAATVALDAIALEKGADILRVHDVKEAAQTVKLFATLKHPQE